MYPLIRGILFLLPEETAHRVTLIGLNLLAKTGLAKLFFPQPKAEPITVMGIAFKNRIGIAAGLDNNADYLPGLAALGVGHIEVGGVTPKAQPGNPRPRLFRLPAYQAIINRKGFANKGVDYLCRNLKKKPPNVVIGVNIAKNKDTPLEQAYDDYALCMRTLNPVADYITINISSPNTPGLRELQTEQYLSDLLAKIRALQLKLPKYVPLAVKISPDLSESALKSLVDTCLKHKIEALIATNTTVFRTGVESDPHSQETGGLSGKPLQNKALRVLEAVKSQVTEQIPIIGVGGIMTAEDVQTRLTAGATLVQVYTGLIFSGPSLILYK